MECCSLLLEKGFTPRLDMNHLNGLYNQLSGTTRMETAIHVAAERGHLNCLKVMHEAASTDSKARWAAVKIWRATFYCRPPEAVSK